MVSSRTASIEDGAPPKQLRGQGKGGNFFALGRDIWSKLWSIDTSNRLNLVSAYLVLLAGTGSDHKLTKWSAKACEQHLGMGKPRAKRAIEELVHSGIVVHTERSTQMSPQYELPELARDADPIFLPVQLITGFRNETPILRRVRETGDALLLRMLIDLYGLIVIDATYGIAIENLCAGLSDEQEPSGRRIATVGAHAIWAVKAGNLRKGRGDWVQCHFIPDKKGLSGDWSKFWERLDLLKQIGAFYYEPWLFDSPLFDAEPVMPLDPSGLYSVADPSEEAKLTSLAFNAARALAEEKQPYLFESYGDADFFVPLTLHHQVPALRNVIKLRVEADTPGRRLAWRRRRVLIEQWAQAYEQLINDASKQLFDRPLRLGSRKVDDFTAGGSASLHGEEAVDR